MWSSIKDLLRDGKTKCVVIEDGKPLYVVLPFLEYQQLQKSENNSIVIENSHEESDINGEIQDIVGANDEALDLPVSTSTIRIEDLPF